MTDRGYHPFRDDKPGPRVRVKDAPLHAPCPRCYLDCIDTGKSLPSSGHLFECRCGMAFFRNTAAARAHTNWLLTRGRIGVHIALGKEGAE